MPHEIIYERYVNPNTKKLPDIPTILKWRDVPFIRSHSIRACAREILEFSRTNEVANVSIIGNRGSGKTTLAKTLAHIIHDYSMKEDNITYTIKILDRKDLENFAHVIRDLTPVNWILIFDDTSFLSAQLSKKQIDMIKHGMTEIRHLQEKDISVIMFFNYHYSLGLDKYMRGGDFKFYTEVNPVDTDNVLNVVGKKYKGLLLAFERIRYKATKTTEHKWTMALGKTGKFTYEYKNPFVPVLFYNGATMRFVVSPKREWIDPICSICDNAKKNKPKSNVDVPKYAEQLCASFGPQVAKQALKVILHENGINVYQRRTQQCMTRIQDDLKTQYFDLKDLKEQFDFTEKKTCNRTKSNIPLKEEIIAK